jgi:HK97 family phage major capsid protein/HK97 family phage prohead protease
MLTRAWATLDIKSFDADAREIEGIATTPTTDRHGDIIESSGAQFTLPIPLLWQHNPGAPVGEVFEARVEPGGIRIKARFAKIDDAGTLRDRLDEAWQSVKAKLVRGLSIGIKPIELVPITKGNPYGGFHIKRWLWAELSVVTLPINADASILNIKSAALGLPLPGVSGALEIRSMQTYTEQITALETSRAAALASMTDLMTQATSKGTTLDPTQASDYDAQSLRVKSIDADLARVRDLEAFNVTKATPVPAPPSPRPVIQVKANVPKGTAFVRAACALLACKGNRHEAAQYAQQWNDSTPEVALYLKAAVAPGTTTDATWAAPLVNPTMVNDFLELLRAATVVDRIANLRKVPFNCKVPSQSASGTYGWVGEMKPKPVTKLAFTSDALGINKVAGIIVLTDELVRLSNPSAEDLARRDMIAGIAAFIDQQFLDPAVAAVAGVNPGSITNGAPTAVATTNPLADIMGLINHFATNNIPVDGLAIVMSPSNALSLSFRTTLDGSPVFPGLSMDGGSYKGIQFITSNVVGPLVVALQPQYVLMADEGGVTIDASREASLQMDSAPASPADATTVMVSLWQMNCVGLRAERFITWKRANANAVKYLTGAAYPAPSGALEVQEPPARTGRKE